MVNENPTVATLLKRVFMFLEDGEFVSADSYCEKVLDIDPENGEAYLGKLMVRLTVKKREDLRNAEVKADLREYQKILKYGDEQLKAEVQECLRLAEKRREENAKVGRAERVKALYSEAEQDLRNGKILVEDGGIPRLEHAEKRLTEILIKINESPDCQDPEFFGPEFSALKSQLLELLEKCCEKQRLMKDPYYKKAYELKCCRRYEEAIDILELKGFFETDLLAECQRALEEKIAEKKQPKTKNFFKENWRTILFFAVPVVIGIAYAIAIIVTGGEFLN